MGGGTVRKIHLIHLSTNQATAMTATFSTPKMRFSTPESWHMMIHSDDSIVIGFNRIQSNVSPCGSLVKENLEVAEMPWVFLNFLLERFFLFAVVAWSMRPKNLTVVAQSLARWGWTVLTVSSGVSSSRKTLFGLKFLCPLVRNLLFLLGGNFKFMVYHRRFDDWWL